MTSLINMTRIFFISLISIFFFLNANSFENRIIYKINNEIITSFDLNKELKYLTLLNPNILKLKKQQILEVTKESLLREKIKKVEILNHLKNINLDESYKNKLIKQNYDKLGFSNLNDFRKKLSEIGYTLEEYEEKISIETLWNQLIYEMYFSKVKIDEEKIRQKVLNNKKKILYNLSEIVFRVKKEEKYKNKLAIIIKEIETNGFENAALLYSISDSKSIVGDLGWVNSASINKNLNKKIIKLKIGEYIEPEVIPGGFLILKLNDIKKENSSLDTKKEINKMIILETNQQLNIFSRIYLEKTKKDIIIEKI